MRREGALALKLRHPNILQVIHFEEGDEGAYLILEPFMGESLLGRLNRLERFRLPEALDLLEQVAQALALAHQHHEVHQSLDPSHVLLDDHTAKLINFSCPGRAEEEPQVTRLELKAYLAPEILQGEPVTPAANVFSLGVLGFRLAAGSLPYSLTFDEPLPYRLEGMPADLGEIPLPLQNLLLQCLAPDPHDRFEDAGAFLFALEQRRESWRTPAAVKWWGWTSERPSQAAGVMASVSRAWDRVPPGQARCDGKVDRRHKRYERKGGTQPGPPAAYHPYRGGAGDGRPGLGRPDSSVEGRSPADAGPGGHRAAGRALQSRSRPSRENCLQPGDRP
jgi:serine/threonine protein kinase